ncbi:hypothetical protein KG088_04590 [Halomonas sp. TRM85114]|uniref:hypothetical protein n=1 Tax=Halomonas jincaotanensis TaxID=2810616 RepID=UPI001BD4FE15|nr:hypothetical protein [Halomonas jincaotanensis]MBS9402899.1 hypothetical protein [Halomonas jincaotanensis]
MSFPIRTAGLFALPLSLAFGFGIATPALADAQRLEADLRALFADRGELEIGDVSEAAVRDRISAEAIRFESESGERLLLERYEVRGNYDSPDSVHLEGLSVLDELTQLPLLEAERIVMEQPSRAVFPFHESLHSDEVSVGELQVDNLSADMSTEAARRYLDDGLDAQGSGRLEIESLHGVELTPSTIGRLELSGIAGHGDGGDGLGTGRFTVASLVMEGLAGLDQEGEERFESLELRELDVESDHLVASLERLLADGSVAQGGEMRLDALALDLARMIELAPAEERTRLRMVSNVLTDGSGELLMDALFSGHWETDNGETLLLSDSHIDVDNAFRWNLDVDLPVRLPEGVEPERYLAGIEGLDDLEGLTILGGEITNVLSNQGLFGRLAPIMAATQGVSEADFIAQARTQAQGFGMMLGPEIGAVLTGLVDMMDGRASELEIRLTLPPDSEIDALSADPLGLPSKLSMQVETR